MSDPSSQDHSTHGVMGALTNPTSVDRRLLALEIKEQVTGLVEARLVQEKMRVHATLKLLLRVGATLLVFLVAIVGYLGYKRYNELTQSIEALVASNVRTLLKDSPSNVYEKEIRAHYERALLSRYLIEVPRNLKRWDRMLEGSYLKITDADALRLVQMLASEHSTLDTLREVHAILRFYRFNREIDPRVAAPLRNLLTQESPPSWLQSDPARWAMLLEALATLNDVSLHQPISSAIARGGLPQKVQEAMLSYLRDTNATPSVTALEKSITTFDRASPMFVPTLQAVAHLSPSSAVLKEALAPMLAKGPATPAEAAALFVVASQLAVWSDGSTQTAQEAARSSVQFPALQRLVNSDYRLYVDHESVVIQTPTTKYGEGYKLPLGFMLEYGFGNSLVELLRKSTDVKDIRRVVDLATVRDSTRTNAIAVLRVTLGGSTTAAKNETNFTSGTLYLLTGEQGVDAHWLDLNGNPRSMPLPESLGQRVVGADIHARPDWLGRRSWAPAPSLFDDDRRLWLPSR